MPRFLGSMSKINQNYCRFCLNLCDTTDRAYTKDHVDIYQTVTGFKIKPCDIPKNICQKCDAFLLNLKIFQAQAAEVEKQLLEFMSQPTDRQECESPFPSQMNLMEFSDDDERPLSFLCNKTDSESDLEPFTPYNPTPPPIDKPYRCDLCKIKGYDCFYVSKDSLRTHIKRIHNRRKVKKDITQLKKKQKPKMSKEQKTQPTSCPDCGREFKNYQLFSDHSQRIHGEKNQICHICGKGYTTQSGLAIHFKISHSDQMGFECFICDFCGKKFNGRENIRNHLKLHHKLRECKDCDKKYCSYQSWLLHRQSAHEPDKNYQCEVCNKVFSAKKYLAQHRKVHDKEGYPCPVCTGKIFSFTTTLRSHIKFQHPEIELPPAGTVLRNYQW